MKIFDKSFINTWINKSKSIIALLFALATTILTFISWDDFSITDVCLKIVSICALFFIAVIISFLLVYFKQSTTLWKKGSGHIIVRYGDILSDSMYSLNEADKCVCVIPMNTAFDTILDEDTTIPFPLVSIKSVHGKWLKKMFHLNRSSASIQQDIYNYLDNRNTNFSHVQRRRGGLREYEIGTCAVVKGDNNIDYVLLATSHFNSNNNVESVKDDVIFAIHKMLLFLDQNCPGYSAYVPLIGTGLSRANLTHKESLQCLALTSQLYTNIIHSTINFVIYDGDKDKVSIYDVQPF